ncbi:MAG: serine hydrolase domain-containing protein [Pseudomonadota bacterium]
MRRDAVPGNTWDRCNPADLGFNPTRLQQVLDDAARAEPGAPSDLTRMMPDGSRHPNDRPLGPVKPRGLPSGLVVRGGQIAGSYGDITAPEVTFSVTKSYISACAGLADLLALLDEPVGNRITDGGYDTAQNQMITWRQMLQQTSEWEGELFGLPDWLDRGRQVGGDAATEQGTVGASAAAAQPRELARPGTFWEYNDVRVNRMALNITRLTGRPLPELLRENIMDPLGASADWSWHGYETSWIQLNGMRVQSVSGGAHWGGGLWISTLDHARFGLLYLREGRWGKRQLLPGEWIRESLRPCAIRPDYGFFWWLNHAGAIASMASPAAFAARGAGGNVIFVDPETDVVIVLRWSKQPGDTINKILETLTLA